MVDVADLALKERVCDFTNRIPTSRWPFFSTTLDTVIPEGSTDADLTFEAERDTLLTDLSISATIEVEPGVFAERLAGVSAEYCNTTYIDEASIAEYAYCCQRKPIFLVGVRENKRMKFHVFLLAAAPVGGVHVQVTISGFQGDGCCS